ncbi:MAG: hypothetical protein ACYS83_11130 [Planctomycetota bacterium]
MKKFWLAPVLVALALVASSATVVFAADFPCEQCEATLQVTEGVGETFNQRYINQGEIWTELRGRHVFLLLRYEDVKDEMDAEDQTCTEGNLRLAYGYPDNGDPSSLLMCADAKMDEALTLAQEGHGFWIVGRNHYYDRQEIHLCAIVGSQCAGALVKYNQTSPKLDTSSVYLDDAEDALDNAEGIIMEYEEGEQ